jgi:hypothetical protein
MCTWAPRYLPFLFLSVLLVFPLFVSAQQSPSWQGPQAQPQVSPTPVPQSPPAPAVQAPRRPGTQPDGTGHPQTVELPTAQVPPSPTPQPSETPPQSTAELAPQPPSSQTPQAHPPTQQSAMVAAPQPRPTKPAYLGIAGNSVNACRYPAGVRVSQVIEGSPAHKGGLKGEKTLTWQDAVTGLLRMTPGGLLLSPFLTDSPHGGTGDLILAVDGKRIHNREELDQEMQRFRPGDTVYFSVLRDASGLQQIPVQLTEVPSSAPPTLEASMPPPAPGS